MSREGNNGRLGLYSTQGVDNPQAAWEEYCGFLELPMDRYMHIQHRLMEEQMSLWNNSGIGQRILDGKNPLTIDEFRRQVPLTTYEDYADILLARREDMLPAPAVTWVETTWEGGKRPVKVAPYTQGMLESLRRNGRATVMIASASDRGEFEIGTNVLSGLAPLPYLTGLMGVILEEEFGFKFMPPHKTTTTMSFTKRTKLGFKMAMSGGLEYVLGLCSVSNFISAQLVKTLSNGSAGSKEGGLPSLPTAIRVLKARKRAKAEGREVLPKDLFDLRGFICAGTDNACYKDELQRQWGRRPFEIFAGTECSLVGTETWNYNNLYFFPDTCFYEFLPAEYARCKERHLPTVTIDQVQEGEEYELVITSMRGGAFARYRMGDMYRCLGWGDAADGSVLPRFRYIDRTPEVIDIAGFTRITRNSIADAIQLSRLPIAGWCAAKEFEAASGHPFLHMFVEMSAGDLGSTAVSEEIIRRHLEIYFSYLDRDYKSLRTILGMEPLQITFLQNGSFAAFEERAGRKIEAINPGHRDIQLLKTAMHGDGPQLVGKGDSARC